MSELFTIFSQYDDFRVSAQRFELRFQAEFQDIFNIVGILIGFRRRNPPYKVENIQFSTSIDKTRGRSKENVRIPILFLRRPDTHAGHYAILNWELFPKYNQKSS